LSCCIKGFRGHFRKLWISSEVPENGVGIGDNRGHQKSRGKFFHISRWFSSISSALSVMFKSPPKTSDAFEWLSRCGVLAQPVGVLQELHLFVRRE
jgi:hypothetical protein